MGAQGACTIILAYIVYICDDVYDVPEPVEVPDQLLAFGQDEGLTILFLLYYTKRLNW